MYATFCFKVAKNMSLKCLANDTKTAVHNTNISKNTADKNINKVTTIPDRIFWQKHYFSALHNILLRKRLLAQFECCCPQTPCAACPRTTLTIRGRGNSWFLPQFLSGVV